LNQRHEIQSTDYEKTKKTLSKLMRHIPPEFWDMRGELGGLWDNAGKTSLNLQYLKTDAVTQSLPQESKPMIKMLVYMGLVESLGVAFIDMALMLLIANGQEMHTRGPYIRHVSSLKELQRLDLAYKLNFLRNYELPLFSEIVNRELRNEVAHLKFKIESDGTVRDSKGALVDINKAIERFWKTIMDIQLIFDGCGFTRFLTSEEREGVKP
jgi:hypothetical protein